MWAWRKKTSEERPARGIARAALEGVSQDELIREAIQALRAKSRADRIGVWLERDSSEASSASDVEEFRGMVWDSSGDELPEEWRRLALELPLPKDLLVSGNSVEQEVSAAASRPVFGPLIGLHRTLWTPVQGSPAAFAASSLSGRSIATRSRAGNTQNPSPPIWRSRWNSTQNARLLWRGKPTCGCSARCWPGLHPARPQTASSRT